MIGGIEQLVKLSYEYGLAPVLVILFVLYTFTITRKAIKKQEERYDTMFNELVEKTREHKQERFKEHFKTRVNNGQTVIESLSELRQMLQADRVYIFEYHNGGYNGITGIDFIKCSNTFEVVSEGTKRELPNLQELHISMFSLWNKKISNHEIIAYKNIKELEKEDINTYYILKNQKIKSIYVIGLYDIDNIPLGFMGVDYCKKEYPLPDNAINMIRSRASKIAGLLY